MAEAKTKPTGKSVDGFLKRIADPQMRQDSLTIAGIMKDATGSEPQMWGESIVGFGTRRLEYAGGREADWPVICFSPRKQNLTLYVMSGFDHKDLTEKLGKHKVSGSCLHIKRLADIDLPTLKKLVRASVKHVKALQRSKSKV